ncbi:MAG: class I SAM-dependent methyltransferase [Chthoniobacteraceae bacterium]
MKISDHYSGERGEHYSALKQSDPLGPGYAVDFTYFLPYLKPSDVLLDFGCGNGGVLRLAAKAVARAEGVEVNPASAQMARGFGLTVHPSAEALPTAPVYDVIMSNHVLEHVRDVCATLERLRQCLKPGGRIVIKLPIDDARTAYQRQWTRDDSDHHLQTWTPRLFANVLFEAGYEVSECRVITSAWHPKLLRFVQWGIAPFLFWLLAVVRSRRQLFAVAVNPVKP